ncbi:MAG: hypothetical protein R3D30_06870 [Hyphomicrobiales bacterium]
MSPEPLIYHGVKVRWNDGRTEMFRYDTEEQARAAERYQFVENWEHTKWASYVGRRINWRSLWHRIVG